MKETRQTFLHRLEGKLPARDIALVEFAYDLSKEAHRTHTRSQGGRYFEHPRACCIILMDEFGIYDKDYLIAMLLHDVGEDSPMFGSRIGAPYLEFVMKAQSRISVIFGSKVARLVIRLTKPTVDHVRFHSEDEWKDFYFRGIAKDSEAVLLKMVDRLHNLRSLPPKTKWAAKQVLETKLVHLPILDLQRGAFPEHYHLMNQKINFQIQALEASPN